MYIHIQNCVFTRLNIVAILLLLLLLVAMAVVAVVVWVGLLVNKLCNIRELAFMSAPFILGCTSKRHKCVIIPTEFEILVETTIANAVSVISIFHAFFAPFFHSFHFGVYLDIRSLAWHCHV